MDPIETALATFAKRSPPRLRYLIGVSGGCDSVALLDVLFQAGFKNLVICHLNHQLRGRESGQDARFVRRLASRYVLPCEFEAADVAKISARTGISLEDAGRRARLGMFARASKKWRCRRVILAHHADDQVETVLMNLGRGAGAGGLRGMRPETSILADPQIGITNPSAPGTRPGRKADRDKTVPLTLLRPLLNVSRQDLQAYADRRGLRFRKDPSNSDPAHLRNRVRHQLIPDLEAVFRRDLRNPILRAATVRAAEDDLLDSLASQALDAATTDAPPPASGASTALIPVLKIAVLRELHPALQRRVLHRWLRALGISDIGFREIETIRDLVPQGAKSAKANLPKNCHARRKAGRLFVTKPSPPDKKAAS